MRLLDQSPGLVKLMLGEIGNEFTGIAPSQDIRFLPSAALPKSFWRCYWSCLLFTEGSHMNCFTSCLPRV